MTFVPRSGITLALFLAVALSASAAREPHTDQFDRPPLDRSWTFFAPGGGSYEVRHGWLHLAAPGPLWMLGDEDSMPPMLLFEPRLKFHRVVPFTSAGLVVIRKDLTSLMALTCVPGPRWDRVSLSWRDGVPLGGGGSAQVVEPGDTWLRLEIPADMRDADPGYFYKRRAEAPWIAAENTARIPLALPDNIDLRFLPGEYWIGLFVDGGSDKPGEGKESRVAFDYFHSPQLQPLAVHAGSTAATIWGSIKQR